MNQIKWMVMGPLEVNVASFDPELVMSNLVKSDIGYYHFQCPAFADSLKNTYLIRSPFDLELTINPKTKTIKTNRDAEFNKQFVINRTNENGPNAPVVLSVKYSLIFVPEKDTTIELIPAIYHRNDFTSKTQIIGGKFNIKKWLRNTDCAFIVPTEIETTVSIKRGDVLFYCRFDSEDKISLVRETDLKKINHYCEISYANSKVAKLAPRLGLKRLYELFKPYNPVKKCPFNFGSSK